MGLAARQAAFNAAMERYDRGVAYRVVGRAASLANVSLQAALLAAAWGRPLGAGAHLVVFGLAYVLADFANGLVHLYMDGNDDYASPVGPLVAAFHLHHRTPRYREAPLVAVYFNESGAKLWLVPWQLLSLAVIHALHAPAPVAWGLAWFAILSSAAEVSHYACHVLHGRFARLLRSLGLILSERHHALHHREENVNYAFLNGMSDPLLNVIARRWGRGYRAHTDLDYATYVGPDTGNR
jgi:hypothetical protein